MLINTILDYVGLIVTLASWFPSNPDQGKVRVRFWVGKDLEADTGAGGLLPAVDIRSTSKEWIGVGPGQYWLGSNEQKQYDVKLDKNQEIDFITLTSLRSNPDDAVCLALVGWTPNESVPNARDRRGYFVGDIFRLCGYAWNHSGQSLTSKDGKRREPLNCGWMVPGFDGYVSQLNINLDVMGDAFVREYAKKDLCYWGFWFKNGGNPWRPPLWGPPSKNVAKNVAPARNVAPTKHFAAFGNKVRVHKTLSAIELCDSPTSWGSSFFSIDEGIFCDMSTKTKVPVCKAGETKGCFEYVKPVVNGRQGYSTKRYVGVRGSTMKYNATYFVTTDENGVVIDDGKGY